MLSTDGVALGIVTSKGGTRSVQYIVIHSSPFPLPQLVGRTWLYLLLDAEQTIPPGERASFAHAFARGIVVAGGLLGPPLPRYAWGLIPSARNCAAASRRSGNQSDRDLARPAVGGVAHAACMGRLGCIRGSARGLSAGGRWVDRACHAWRTHIRYCRELMEKCL